MQIRAKALLTVLHGHHLVICLSGFCRDWRKLQLFVSLGDWRGLKRECARRAILVMAVVGLLHLALGLGIVLYFFAY